MNRIIMALSTALLLGILTAFTSCNVQNQQSVESKPEQTTSLQIGDTVSKIGNNIRCIFQDSKNNFWFATDGEGVFKYNEKTIIQFKDKHGLCSNFVWNVQEGKDGNIWFKTRDGICYFDDKKFTTIKADENILEPAIYNYINDDLLIEHYYNGKSLVKIKLPQTSPLKNENNSRFHYDIYCTYKDSKGNLWFGTSNAGVCKFDGKTYTWLNNKALGAPVRSIFEDKNGIIWIGNNGYGLLRYDGKTVTNFTKEKKLENPDFLKTSESKEGTLARVWTITDDKEGNLWIGTYDAGVWKFDGKTLTNYTSKDGLGSDAIWTIYKDKNDKLWFGTDGAGVYTFNGNAFKKF
jgi:ligand-binding sensor domain-containing protein